MKTSYFTYFENNLLKRLRTVALIHKHKDNKYNIYEDLILNYNLSFIELNNKCNFTFHRINLTSLH